MDDEDVTMTKTHFFDHKQIAAWQRETDDLKGMKTTVEGEALTIPTLNPRLLSKAETRSSLGKVPALPFEPLIPSEDGFVLGQDDRLVLRLMLNSQAAKYGKRGLTPHEAYAIIGRMENMPFIEEAAKNTQRDMIRLLDAVRLVMEDITRGHLPDNKKIVNLARVIREVE